MTAQQPDPRPVAPTPELYERVWIRPVPGCPAEGLLHGWAPYLKGASAQIIEIEGDMNPRHPDHLYFCTLDSGYHAWFARDEIMTLAEHTAAIIQRATGAAQEAQP